MPNISYTFLVGIFISILNQVPNSSAWYFIHILSGYSYLHTESSAHFQCLIFHAYSEWAFLSPYWIQCLIPVPDISYIYWVGILISMLNQLPDSRAGYLINFLSGHYYLSMEFKAHSQCLIFHTYSEWAFWSLFWIQCPILVLNISYTFLVGIHISIWNPRPNSSAWYFIHILSVHSYLHTESSAWSLCPFISSDYSYWLLTYQRCGAPKSQDHIIGMASARHFSTYQDSHMITGQVS